MQRRKVTLKLDPNAAKSAQLETWTRLHCELYNAALEERIDAWRKASKSISYDEQQSALPQIKADRPEFKELGSHALQQTLRRLDLALQSFFCLVKAGQTPGFPRFKSSKRFSGFAYPDPAGWKIMEHGGRGATLRLGSGEAAMSIRARGRHRFGVEAKPNAITDWATFDDGAPIENPRWLRVGLPKLAALQRERARKRQGLLRHRRLGRRIARLHERIGNLSRDFVHKETTRMVAQCAVLATEALTPKTMSRSGKGTVNAPGRRVRQKAGLNREILSAAFSMAHPMLGYKAEEAGTRLHLSHTRQLKPSQRCAACWELVPKTSAQRVHGCPHCGQIMPRDQNSALVVLIDANTPGTGVAARPKPLPRQRGKSKSVTRETPTTTAQAA